MNPKIVETVASMHTRLNFSLQMSHMADLLVLLAEDQEILAKKQEESAAKMERQTNQLVRLTLWIAILTTALLVFTIALFYEARAQIQHEKLAQHANVK